jgi:hypothetical protein
LLFEEEYATLQRTGRAPVVSRSCVLCYRFHAQDYILTLRPNLKRIGGVHEGVVQVYRNLCDEPGGYFREALLHPDPNRFDGFIDPIAIFCRSTLRAQLSLREGQRWRIDQSAIVYPLAPPSLLAPPAVQAASPARLGDF